jgi:hypothetical protein
MQALTTRSGCFGEHLCSRCHAAPILVQSQPAQLFFVVFLEHLKVFAVGFPLLFLLLFWLACSQNSGLAGFFAIVRGCRGLCCTQIINLTVQRFLPLLHQIEVPLQLC